MSMKTLMSTHTVTIERQSVTNTASMSSQKSWSTSNRSTLPTSAKCRIVPVNSEMRVEFAQRGIEKTHDVYFYDTDPQVDARDRLVFGSRQLYVTSDTNADELSRYWRVGVNESTEGPD